jgi:hypothetical protein
MPRRGHITFIPQVHNTTQRTASENFYGSSTTLGKSRAGLYTNNFNTNSNSIYKVDENEIAQAFYDNRFNLTTSDISNNAYNPDFPTKSVQYQYNFISNTAYRGISTKGNEVAATNLELRNRPGIAPHTVSNAFHNRLTTTNTAGAEDLPGKYTPNLNTEGLNFQGTKSTADVRTTIPSGGGFGSDSRITFEAAPNTDASPPTPAITIDDIHDYRSNFTSGEFRTARQENIDRQEGVLTINEHPMLGSFEKTSGDLADAYSTVVLQS